MKKLTVTVTPEQHERLQVLAKRMGHKVSDCLQVAVTEYIDHWETHLDDLARLDDGERAVLRSAAKD